jgi:glycogen synthase
MTPRPERQESLQSGPPNLTEGGADVPPGVISRLTDQKGFDLLALIMEDLMG